MADVKNGKITLKIATYNIAAGRYNRDLSEICREIVDSDADIIGLQEVDLLTNRSGKIDMLKEIASAASYPYYLFVPAIKHDGGQYGTAILSKYPIESHKIIPLDNRGIKTEGRALGIFQIDVLGEKISFFNTHIEHTNDSLRAYHFEQLGNLLKDYSSYILTADFNTADYTAFSVFPNCRIVNNEKNPLPSFIPDSLGIDNIVMSSDWTYSSPALAEAGSSDHRLLFALLEKSIG